VPALRSLSQGLARSLRQARLPVDRKPFRPHVTLARCGDRLTDEQVSADLDTLAGYAGPFWTVGSVDLVSSVLGPRPAYRSERRWDLDA
jgi:2'-5' RNA ligase